MRFTAIARDVPLTAEHDVDAEAVLARIDTKQRIRGMFVLPIVQLLTPSAKAAVLATLDERPRGGTFLPFLGYSRRDYLRIVLAAADAGDPALSRAQRIRAIARNDFVTFSESLLGRTIRAAVSTTTAAILKTPSVYDAVAPAPGARISARALADGRLELRYERYPLLWPYHLGQLEGMAVAFGNHTVTDVDVDVDSDAVVYVTAVS